MLDTGGAEPKPLILVVDDDRMAREMARSALEEAGYVVAEAANGAEALKVFEGRRPSLVLLDLQMPVLDGFSACEQLRSRYPEDHSPVLVVTGNEDRESVDRAYEVGATDFTHKPVNWPLLVHRVRYLLRVSDAFGELRRSQASLASSQRIARLGSFEWDADSNEMHWSDETYRIFGLVPGSVEASYESFWKRVHPDDREKAREAIRESLKQSKQFSVEHRVQRLSGEPRHVRQQGEISEEEGRAGTWIVGTVQDVTEQWAAQQKINYLASYDSLTGLVNRRLFREQLERAMAAARERNHSFALLFMDLDRFKRINDTLGHDAGDQILKAVAERLRLHVRGSDVVARGEEEDEAAAVSRLGGDEFTVLLSKITRPEEAGDVARRILRVLPEPISVNGQEVAITGSVGIAVYPTDGEDADELVRHADAAMYHAKDRGRNNCQFFSDSMNAESLRKLTVESRLREALERGELRLHYQPIVDLRTGAITGAEALLRWNHPELGTVSPSEFVPVSEETGLIVPIGEWVLRTACCQAKQWQEEGYLDILMSVNVSIRQFAHHDLRDTVARALQDSGIDPSYLELELTESFMMQDDEAAATVLRDLRAIGVRVALDDFGTGYSSLSYVTRFPLDTLKMDRCFVRDIDSDPGAAGIASAVISMAHSLDARVVAEGVDTEEQATFLRAQGCDEMQGFLFSEAVPADEFVRLLQLERNQEVGLPSKRKRN
jgi:diguanylate cyclase (GGDEF)-like protein/PAS domain S-box-containing protein